MIVPNKFTPFDKSIMARLPCVLTALVSEIQISNLFKKVESNFEDVGEFILALDSLYVLGKVEFDKSSGKVRLC